MSVVKAIRDRAHWVLDFETLNNCTILVVENYKTEDCLVFEMSRFRNDFLPLVEFFKENIKLNEWHITFNGISFDSQIAEFIIRGEKSIPQMFTTGEEIAKAIYAKAQETINKSNMREWAEYPEWKLHFKQIDVFKLNHWDNPAKSSSLKWIQYSMDWDNIQEMPIHHNTEITTREQIDMIITYCKNDVRSTKEIMNRSKDQILLRKNLSIEYDINLYSASEPKISKELFAFFLSQKLGISKYDLKTMRTKREIMHVKELILPYTQFNTTSFKELLGVFLTLDIDGRNTKKSFSHSITYKGIKTDYGLGGVHGARESGIYESKEGRIIMSSDVTSYYPNLAIRNRWSPAHIQKEAFCELYEWFFNERTKIPKKDPRNYVYKIILNSTFGLSIDEHSFLYDPQLGMQITINGQLSLSMLYEMLCEGIPGAYPLMLNTDGMEIMIPSDQKELYIEICAQWEQITQLRLEHDQYKKLVLRDVNNYLAIPMDPEKKPKTKGVYEYDSLPLHKNKSFLVITKALNEYFINNVMPEQYLSKNRNILDYCGGAKAKGEWFFLETSVVKGEIQERKLQKIIRYYISNSGGKIVKNNRIDGRKIQIEAGPWMQTEMNKIRNLQWESYDINEAYYLNKIYKEISSIKSILVNQLSMF